MRRIPVSIHSAIVIVATLCAAHAAALECQGTFINQGMSEAQLLEVCGEPTSRDGANWHYDIPGSVPAVVTLGEGVVMFIRDANDVQDDSASPMGDSP